ncbi:hypothetical protein [Hymenobacter gummosus]|uniref:hypothetical protein n=1 Tax=Hymenobacter gummosus TaxID=1776032 RepID=UPI0014047F59|nr:hypothetical protein [Hymenobacter gummosus]
MLNTVEYIYPPDSAQRSYQRVLPGRCPQPARQQLAALPAEYQRIRGIAWFLNR